MPPIRVRALDSSETQLGAALHGRPALVSLWATWCDACREEMPELNRLDAWAHDRGAVVVGVAIGEPVARIATFAAEKRMPYLVLVDEDFQLADALGEKRVPSTLVVDRRGRIVYAGGAVDARAVAALQSVVDASAPPPIAGNPPVSAQ
jgi:peroxiredoxin